MKLLEQYCKNCGTKIDKNQDYCPDCGTKIKQKIICKNCNVETGDFISEPDSFSIETKGYSTISSQT